MGNLGPFSSAPVIPANQPAPVAPAAPFPAGSSWQDAELIMPGGLTIKINYTQFATQATADRLAAIIGAQVVEKQLSGPYRWTPQLNLDFQPPRDPSNPNSPLPAVQTINAGLLADACNKYGFGSANPVWNQLPPWCLKLLGEKWNAALNSAVLVF